MGHVGCMHMCPCFLHLGVAVDFDTLFRLLVACRFEVVFTRWTGRTFSQATEGLWKSRVLGGRDACVPTFKTPTMQPGSLHQEEVMHNGYRPKMLLYTLDELFYVFDQMKWQQGLDEKIMIAYKILCLSML